jgi:hypothetical protein
MRERPACNQVVERRTPYRTVLTCACGWTKVVFHRNALARASIAGAKRREHLASRGAA